MTANVVALVEGATLSPTDGLWDIYRNFVPRSWAERRRMRRALEVVKDESLIDMRGLFSLDEAWDKTGRPTVAISPWRNDKVGYTRWNDSAGFHDLRQSFHSLNNYHFLDVTNSAPQSFVTTSAALVPLVPKSLAPWNPLVRRKTYVLFDADWKALPVDPYLLERVNDNQFRILGHWDLTDKEREIMALMGQ